MKLYRQDTGQLVDQPVVKHTDTVDFFINFRQLILYPEKPRKGVQRVGLAGFQIEFFFQARIGMDQFGYFVIGSGIYIAQAQISLPSLS